MGVRGFVRVLTSAGQQTFLNQGTTFLTRREVLKCTPTKDEKLRQCQASVLFIVSMNKDPYLSINFSPTPFIFSNCCSSIGLWIVISLNT